MLKSMTGFACTTTELTNSQGEKGFLTLNVKSLNSRHFEAHMKLPPALQSIEVMLIAALKKQLLRGKITVTLTCSNPNLFKGPVQISLVTLQGYLEALKQAQHSCALAGQLQITDIINLPNILIMEDVDADQSVKETIAQSFESVIEQISLVQEKEGKALLEDIQKRCLCIEQKIETITQLADQVYKRKKTEIEDKLSLFAHDFSELDQVRRQLQIELEKSDIHEEITRFKIHLATLQELLMAPAPLEKGRQIDFIIQELSREINTATAKCADSGISSLAIGIKVELEKIREQAQNVI